MSGFQPNVSKGKLPLPCLLLGFPSADTFHTPTLGVATSTQGHFTVLADSARRTAFNLVKVIFSDVKNDHLTKNCFRVLEVISFLDWVAGALYKKISLDSNLPEDVAQDWLGKLSCADKTVRDGTLESGTLVTFGLLKKRGVWCSFLAKILMQTQKSALLFASISKEHLPPLDTMKEISSEL